MKTNLIFFVLVILAACGGNYESSEIASGDVYQPTEPAIAYAQEEDRIITNADFEPNQTDNELVRPQKIERKVIRNASLSFQVEHFDSASQSLEAAVKGYDAYVVESRRSGAHRQISGNMIIRVRSDQLDPLTEELLKQSVYLQNKDISSDDVTEEFVDLEIRLRNKKEVEKKYLEILTKAKTIKEILEVENQIRVIREEIEAKEGRLKYLRNQVAYSTIHLNYYQENWVSAKTPGFSFWQRIGDGLSGGWDLLLGFVVGMSYAWPFLLILTGIFFWVRWYLRKRKLA